jgi:hypothetical protein
MMLLRLARRLDPYLLVALLLSSFALYPLLNNPGLPVTSDGLLQPYRLVELDAALQNGYWYPRWAPNFWLGYGYPFFNFYAPFSYYLGEAFHLLGASFEMAVRLVAIAGVLLAAGSAYALAGRLFGPLGGLVASAAYVNTPHLLSEIYRRGDYPQLLALALLPLIMLAHWRWADDGQRRWLVTATLSLAALVTTHSVTAMLFAPVYALWLLLVLWWRRDQPWPAFARIVAANLLALGLSAFFWLPAIAERPLVQTQRLLTGHFDFRLHFLTLTGLLAASPLPDPRILNGPASFGLGQPQIALACLGIVAAVWLTLRRGAGVTAGSVWWAILTAIAGILMTLPVSAPLYASNEMLALTQFPWRFLGIAGLGLALVGGAATTLLPGRWPAWTRVAPVALALVAILWGAWPETYPVAPFDRYLNLTTADITRFELDRGPMGTSSASEFLPRWVASPPGHSPMVEELLANRPVLKPDTGSYPPGVQLRIIGHGPTWDEVEVDTPQPFGMLFRTLYFPGWRAWVDRQPAQIEPFQTYGMILLPMPAGSHRVLLRFEDTPVRASAQWVSFLSLLGLAGWLAYSWRRCRLTPPDGERSSDRLAWRPAAALGLVIVLILAARLLYIDPHTTWFRQQAPMATFEDGTVILGDKMQLVGYQLEPEKPHPGDVWSITLYWQGQIPVTVNYKAFTHLLTSDQTKLLAQRDNEHPGQLPTSWWRQDKLVVDPHSLRLPPDLQPGRYPLVVGMYDPKNGDRLMPPGGQASYFTITYLVVE